MVRFKNRWLLVEFIVVASNDDDPSPPSTSASTATSASFDAKHVYTALRQSVLTHFGDAGWGAVASAMSVKYFSPTTHLCILRVARDPYRMAWGGVTLLTAINGVRVIPHVVHVSGTIKHVQRAAIQHNRQVVARVRARARTQVQEDAYGAYLAQSTREMEALQE